MRPSRRRPVHHGAEDYTWSTELQEPKKPASPETKAKLGSAAVDDFLEEIDRLINEVTEKPQQLGRVKGAGAPPKEPMPPDSSPDQLEQVFTAASPGNHLEQKDNQILTA